MAQAVEALDNFIHEGRSNIVAKRKPNIFRAILKLGKKSRETERKKRYLQHYKANPKNAMTYVEWMKKGEQSPYFKGLPKRKTAEARMREAGLTLKERSRFK